MEQNQKNTLSIQESSVDSLAAHSNGTLDVQKKNELEDFLNFDTPPATNDAAREGIDLIFSIFKYKIHTFQFFGVVEGKERFPVHTFTDKEKALRSAIKHRDSNFGIYFMVNEGDGIAHPPKKTGRSQASVIALSKCFIDADGCELDRITKYLARISVTPHLIIETSPGRYHIYFCFEAVSKTEEIIRKWKAIQAMLHRLGNPAAKPKDLKLDETMGDYSKVLRVPGFLHPSKLSLVKVLANTTSTQRLFTLDELFTKTRGQSFLDYNVTTFGVEDPVVVPTLADAPKVEVGERFHKIRSFAMSLANKRYTRDEALQSFILFVKCIPHPDNEFIKGGNLTPKAMSLFNSALGVVKDEDIEKIEEIKESLMKSESTDTSTNLSPWHLPDSFYTEDAPNGVGEAVKEAMSLSRRPCAALSFGVILSVLSCIKSMTHVTSTGGPCSLYVLCVAGTGFGKTEQLTILQNTLSRNGYRTLVANEIKSKEGIYTHLERNDGVGLLVLDEVSKTLKSMQEKNANPFQAQLYRTLLTLFSAGSLDAYDCGAKADTGKKKGEEEVILPNPVLSICGFAVTESIEEIFNSESITSGLFQRFIPIVANESTYVPRNLASDNKGSLKSKLFAYTSRTIKDLTQDGEPVDPLENKPINLKRIEYEEEAYKIFLAFEEEFYKLKLSCQKDPDRKKFAGIYTRPPEQVDRISTVLAKDKIDVATINFAIKFMRSRFAAALHIVENSLGGNRVLKDALVLEERVLSEIAKQCIKQNKTIVSKRSVFKSVRGHFPYGDSQFMATIKNLIEQGKIYMFDNYKDIDTKSKGYVAFKLDNVL